MAGPIYVSNAGQLGDVGETVVCAGAACHGYLSFCDRDPEAAYFIWHLFGMPLHLRLKTRERYRTLLDAHCCGKSDAGFPDVAIPPHLLPVLAGHFSKCVGPGVIRCCFRPRTADIWRLPRCTGSSTRPATWPVGPIFGSTSCATHRRRAGRGHRRDADRGINRP